MVEELKFNVRADINASTSLPLIPIQECPMAAHAIPHFKNDVGLPSIRVSAKEFMCIGASAPFDHPHIFIDMGSDSEAVCPYCSTLFRYDAALSAACDPRECLYENDKAAA